MSKFQAFCMGFLMFMCGLAVRGERPAEVVYIREPAIEHYCEIKDGASATRFTLKVDGEVTGQSCKTYDVEDVVVGGTISSLSISMDNVPGVGSDLCECICSTEQEKIDEDKNSR